MAASDKVSGAEGRIDLCVKWSGEEFQFEGLPDTTTITELKQLVYHKTGVRPERQKRSLRNSRKAHFAI